MSHRPYILSIAGFDPSSGAGLTADIKTMEALKCYGLSVCSSITVQNEDTFLQVDWVSLDLIKEQIAILFEKYRIDIVKIGIVENWNVLNNIIDFLKEKNKGVKIIVDPILKSSSSFKFHDSDIENLSEVLSKIYLLTPNYKEIQQLYPDKSIEETIQVIRSYTNLYLKGGHREKHVGKDELFTKDKQFSFNPKLTNVTEKHGSGCILSSSIAAYLGLGFPLQKACYRAKRHTEKALASNKSLLAYHSK